MTKSPSKLVFKHSLRTIVLTGTCIIASAYMLNTVKAEDNLVKNPGFENVTNGRPSDWRSSHLEGDLKTQGVENVLDADVHHSGARAHKISVPDSAAKDDYGYYQDNIAVEPSTKYRCSYWIKGEHVDSKIGASVILHEIDEDGKVVNQVIVNQKFRKTFDWEKDEITFTTAPTTAKIRICNTIQNGTAWFDDFSLVEVKVAP